MDTQRASSAAETPLPSTETGAGDASTLPEEQVNAMQDVLNHVYDYRLPE